MDFDFSIYIILKQVIIAGLLFLFTKLAGYLFPRLIKNKSYRDKLKKYMPIAELLVWGIYFLFAFKAFVLKNQYIALVFLVVLVSVSIWGSWFILKDYISGVLFKSDKNLEEGERISTLSFSGRIMAFNRRTLQVETEKGNNILIPYSQLLTESIKRYDSSKTITGKTFDIQVKTNSDLPKLTEKIEKELLLLPWISLKKKPIIKITEQNESYSIIEISIYAIDSVYFSKIENHIKEKFSK